MNLKKDNAQRTKNELQNCLRLKDVNFQLNHLKFELFELSIAPAKTSGETNGHQPTRIAQTLENLERIQYATML